MKLTLNHFSTIAFYTLPKRKRSCSSQQNIEQKFLQLWNFKFNCFTKQQKNSLSEENTLTRRDLRVVLHCLNNFLLQFEAARKSDYYSLATPKALISYTFPKVDLFCHHLQEISEHSKRHIRLWFWLELNKNWIISFEKFTLNGSEFLLEEIIELRHSEAKKTSYLIENLLDPRVFSREFYCNFDWLIVFSSRNFILLNSFHTEFFSHFVSILNNYHFPIFFSGFPVLLNMIFSVSNNNMNWSLKFGPYTVSLEVKILWTRQFWFQLRFH